MSADAAKIVLLPLLAAALLLGCEEDVVAVDSTDYPYSMWSVLDPLADTQFVRVFPVGATLTPGDPAPLDARFVSTDLTTDETHDWRDSVFIDERGVVEHVFYAPFRVAYGHRYRLQITGGDGRSSFVEVEVPSRTALSLEAADTTQGVLLPGYVRGDPPRLIRSMLEVSLSYVSGFSASGCPLYRFITYPIPYDGRIRPDGDGWWFIVNLREIYVFAWERVKLDPSFVDGLGIILGYVRFSTIVANEAWDPPGGRFDPNVLVQPGTMENVQNGFGFVGAGYRLSAQWNLSPRVVHLSGFRSRYVAC